MSDETSSEAAPKQAPLEELRDMLAHLHARDTDNPKRPNDAADRQLAARWADAMRKLVGPECFQAHQTCRVREEHGRGFICDACGYSYNLYAQELRRLLRRQASNR